MKKHHCPDCGERDLNKFHRNKSRKNGHCCYCKLCGIKRTTKWQANNPKRQLYIKNYQKTNREKVNENTKRWRQRNPEKEKLRYVNWLKTDQGQELTRERQRKRRAIKRNAFVEKVIDKEIFMRDGWRCQICEGKVDKKLKFPHPMSPSIDHIIPLSKGGTHEPKNVQLAHMICNSMKHAGIRNDQLRMF